MDENNVNGLNQEVSDEDVENVLKVRTGEEVESGEMKRQYHYGRCDVGSPFAKGTPFDVDDSCQ